jgi:hypothetical protein
MEQKPITLSLNEIAHINWTDFTPAAKKNFALMSLLFRYAEPLRFEIAEIIELQCDALDEKTLFTLKALYHILNQWVLEIPKIQLENLEHKHEK